jgi:hypothetical protein
VTPARAVGAVFAEHAQHLAQFIGNLVATLRSMAGRSPYDRALTDLVGELSTRSDAFRTWWAAHNVRHHQTGTKRLHHPVVGDLTLN